MVRKKKDRQKESLSVRRKDRQKEILTVRRIDIPTKRQTDRKKKVERYHRGKIFASLYTII